MRVPSLSLAPHLPCRSSYLHETGPSGSQETQAVVDTRERANGLVVRCFVAIEATRVRFPVGALLLPLSLLF